MDIDQEPEADCSAHTKRDGSWWAYDALAIPLCRVCAKCIKSKLAKFRPEVLTSPSYSVDEDIEGDVGFDRPHEDWA